MASLSNDRRSKRSRKVQRSQPVTPEEAKNNAELPLELEADIFARLTLPELASLLQCLSKSWATSRLFRKVLDQKHPKMIAIVGIGHGFRLTVAAFDFASGQWQYRVLQHLLDDTAEHRRLRRGYVNQACFAHDAGLLCFVIPRPRKVCPIVVCNVLTSEWKAIEPFQECKQRDPVLVQLVVDDTTGQYKVTVVYQYVMRGVRYVAVVYDSETKLWSMKEGGVVYGQKVVYHAQAYLQAEYYSCGYNCESGEWFEPEKMSHNASLYQGHPEANFVTARDGKQRMFKLKQEPGEDTYRISEYESVTDSTVVAGVRVVDSYQSSLPVMMPDYSGVCLRATDGFLLVVVDHWVREETVRYHRRQTMRVRDQVTREWHEIPMPREKFMMPSIDEYFMCELRWNAIP